MYEYKDPRARARLAIIAVTIWMIINLGLAASEYMTVRAIERFQQHMVDISVLERIDAIGIYTGVVSIISLVITITISGFWINRVNKNAQIVDRGDMTVSPGANVGFFFVPIANLWKPFVGLRETLQVSTDPYDAPAVPVPLLMRLWWAGWLISGALNNIAFRLAIRAETLDEIRNSAWFNLCLTPVDLIVAWLFIGVIREITRCQVENMPGHLAEEASAEPHRDFA